MTQTSLLSFPIIDQDALDLALAEARGNAEGMQFHSRSQAMLKDAIEKEAILAGELKDARADKTKLDSTRAELDAISERMRVAIDDVAVELNAVNKIIALLKAAGVEI